MGYITLNYTRRYAQIIYDLVAMNSRVLEYIGAKILYGSNFLHEWVLPDVSVVNEYIWLGRSTMN
jgi:hypothetical protein